MTARVYEAAEPRRGCHADPRARRGRRTGQRLHDLVRHRPRGAWRRRGHVQFPLYRAAPARSRSAAGARGVLRRGGPGRAIRARRRPCSSAASRWAAGLPRTSRPTAGPDPLAGSCCSAIRCTRLAAPRIAAMRTCRRYGCPMLFVQGSRDAFGTPAELQPVLAALHKPGVAAHRRGRRSLVQGRRATRSVRLRCSWTSSGRS